MEEDCVYDIKGLDENPLEKKSRRRAAFVKLAFGRVLSLEM